MRKKVIGLLNGFLDIPLHCLNGATPLQLATTPHLDHRFSHYHCRLLSKEGYIEKYEALALALGYQFPPGALSRGFLQAHSQGIPIQKGQWAFSFRFVSMARGVVVALDEELLSFKETEALCSELNKEAEKHGEKFYPLDCSTGVYIGKDPALYPALWGEKRKVRAGDSWVDSLPGGKDNKALIQKLQGYHRLLSLSEINALKEEWEALPVNGLLLFEGGAGLPDSYLDPWPLSNTLLYSSDACLIGLAKFLKLASQRPPPEKQTYDALREFSKNMDRYFQRFSTLLLDIDYVWESTLKGRVGEKIKRMEYLDAHWIGPFLKCCEKQDIDVEWLALDNTNLHLGERVQGEVFHLSCQKKDMCSTLFEESSLKMQPKGFLLSCLR